MVGQRGRSSSLRWGSFVAGLAVALVTASLSPPAQAAENDPNELWATVYSNSTFDVLPDATVTLYDDAGTEVETATSDADGMAGFTGLSAGDYYVSAVADGYVEQFYDGSPDLAGATTLYVGDDYSDSAYLYLAAEPQVGGTVTGPGGTPVDGGDVTLYSYDAEFDYWDWADSTSTDPDGHYSFGGLADGSYRLGFSAPGYVEEYYDNQPDVESGDDVVVTTGGAVVTADAELTLAKHITGTVTDGGTGLGDVSVSAQQEVTDEFGDTYWDDVAYAYTEPDGTYSLDVDPGDYRVRFQPDSALEEWWNDAHVVADADLVTVTTGDVSGIDAEVDEGGTIAGTVTAAAGGAGLPDIGVSAYRWNPDMQDWDYVSSGTTDATGHYSVGNLLGGSYRIGFDDWNGTYLSEYYDNAEDVEAADDIPVTIGSTTGSIDAALDKSPVITGTVSGPGGPLTSGNYEVTLYEPDRSSPSGWSDSYSNVTRSGATYTINGLAPGRYRLGVSAPGMAPEFWADQYDVTTAGDIVAAKNEVETANVTLGNSLQLTGTVTDLFGAVPGADVEVQRKNPGPDGSYWDTAAYAQTDASGHYVADLAPGSYRVRFSDSDHVAEWYNASTGSSRATWITLAASDATANAVLDRLGRIGGTVTGPSGAVSGAQIRVYRYNRGFDDENTFVQVRSGTTDPSGNYLVTGLTPGNYRVGFTAPGMAREFNVDKADVELADDVPVSLNQTADVDALLAASTLAISGTVTGTTGATTAPVEDARVAVERRVVKQDGVAWVPFATAFTDAAGAWSVPAANGDYRVAFEKFGFQDQWWNAAGSVEDADTITVDGANRTGIDANLVQGGVVSGTLTDTATGQPISGADVSIESTTGPASDYDSTDANGHYELANLSPGQYRLVFEAEGYLSEWWNNKPTYDVADQITVAIGSPATADAALTKAAKLSGTVTGAGGAPLADVEVDVYRQLDGVWDYDTSGWTGADGTWSAYADPGTVRLEFVAPYQSSYLGEWWNDKPSLQTADPISVASSNITNLNAQLATGGTLTGTVTGPDGQPIQDTQVAVYASTAANEFDNDWSAWTDEYGHYTVAGLPAGSYRLGFDPFDQRFLPEYHADKPDLSSADPVAVTAGGTSTVNAQLAAAKSIRGNVTGVGGRGLEEVDVATYLKVTTPDGVGWNYFSSDTTDADGDYAAPARPGVYRVEFSEQENRITEYWNNVTDFGQATPVTVAGADVPGVNAQLGDGSVITGTVTYPAQKSGWQASVSVYDIAGGEWMGDAVVNAHRNDYAIDGLPAGSYRVEFARDYDRTPAEAQFFSGKSENLGAGSATPVTLGAGETRTDVNAVLADGGVLTGLVRDGSGTPLEGCAVDAFTQDGARAGRTARPTGADGLVRITGLTTGGYSLFVHGGECGFRSLYYDGVGQLTTNRSNATTVTANRTATVAIPQDLVVPTGGEVENNTLPTISDTTPQAGQTISATPGSWTPSDGTYSYEWLSAGAVVAGQTAQTYVVRSADVGQRISVRVTASKANYVEGVATSAQTQPVTSAQPTITNTAPPVINDTTPLVGQTLTTSNGTWSETSGLTYAYQWTRDGADIAGATSSSYPVVAADEGKVLRVRVTASKTGFVPGAATSSPTGPVAQPTITNTAPPVINDTTPLVGQTLTTSNGTWSETSGLTYAYQWTRDGADIAGATSSSYPVVAADEGKVLRVRVTASRTGFTSGSATSAATEPVVKPTSPTITNSAQPQIDDATPVIGQTLHATNGTWSETSGLAYAYQWTANGTDIAGAVASSYTVAAADEGKVLRVRVTASKPGFVSGTATSDPTQSVARPMITNTAQPVILDGTPQVGQALGSTNGTWSPNDGLTYAYQWSADGANIAGATGSTYTVAAADAGKVLRLRVTASRAGYDNGVATSDPTAPVVDPTLVITNATPPSVTGTLRVGSMLSAGGDTWTPADVTRSYQWLRDGSQVAGATASTYELTADDLGSAMSVRVSANRAGYQSGSATSAPTAAVAKGRIVAKAPKVSGKPKVKKTLTAKPGASNPAEVKVTYQWLRNGKAIKGAKGKKYKLTRQDRGKKIQVKVTRTAAGYQKLVKKSKAVKIRR